MTYLILAALTIAALAVYLLAERASTIRAWVERDPIRLDDADQRRRCARPGCRINHDAYRGR